MTPPRRHPYDPGDPYPDATFEGRCPLLVLLATPDADPDWALRSTVELARQWAGRGERVLLADLSLRYPRLHDVVGVANAEGVSDFVLFGASLKRVARRTPEGFFFASAGTPVADAARVLGSPRWTLLTEGFARTGAHLVAYLPLEEPGAADILAYAERVLLLAGRNGSDAFDWVGAVVERVAGVLAPRSESGAAGDEGSLSARAAGAAAGTAAAGALPDASPVGTSAEPADVPVAASATTREAQPPRRYGKPKHKESFFSSTWRVLLVVGLTLLALGVVLVMARVIPVPWLAQAPGDVDEPALTVGAPAERQAAAPADTFPARYFVTLDSYAAGEVAMMQAEALRARRSDLLFIVSPVEVNGEVFHRLLVGVSADSAALDLKASLSQTLSTENPADWVVRPGPLSFHLGTFQNLEGATARVSELETLQIPAYMLRQTGTPPPQRFDVWAGAYADSAEATYLVQTLNANGIVPILVRRSGELIPE